MAILIGTSGWMYAHWREKFYPKQARDKELEYYGGFFRTVEVNSSFYRLPEKQVFEDWKKRTGADFVFSVKGSRFITHMKKLNEPSQPLERLSASIGGLGRKCGPILFQLPPNWNKNTERLKNFLEALPARKKFVFEFRNHTWYSDDVFELLKKHNACFCAYHLAGHTSPLVCTADFMYLRLHGPGGKYQGSYSTAALRSWAGRVEVWQKTAKDVYVYFDNDQGAYAVKDALRLKKMCTVQKW